MATINQAQLISSLKQLKEIKPNQKWAVLLKSTLLENKVPGRMTGTVSAQKISFIDAISSVFFQRKLAYSFAAVLFFIVGVFGFAKYTVPGDLLFPIRKISDSSVAALTGQTKLQNSVAVLNSRINDLAQVAKDGRINSIPSAISEISANALTLSKDLKSNLINDPKTIKEIAVSLKTLADVPGTDLTANSDVKDLYQTIVENQIADLQKTTLAEDQKIVLDEIKDLYFQGKYAEALEKILLINK